MSRPPLLIRGGEKTQRTPSPCDSLEILSQPTFPARVPVLLNLQSGSLAPAAAHPNSSRLRSVVAYTPSTRRCRSRVPRPSPFHHQTLLRFPPRSFRC